MISKIGLIALALISFGCLYMLDYYLHQDQKNTTEQLHAFVQQSQEMTKAQALAREKLEMQLMSDIALCQKEALQTHNLYVDLIRKAASTRDEHSNISTDVIGDAAGILEHQIYKCKKAYDSRLLEGI
jgi:hypothetical protein